MNEKNNKVMSFAGVVIDIIAIGISVVALLTSILPQLLPWNSNQYEKANAGDVDAQMFLADHFFEIGDYNESIYWYKIASSEGSKYRAIACNNLGYIYATTYDTSDEISYHDKLMKAYQSFLKAGELGLEMGRENAAMILYNNSPDDFPQINYEMELGKLMPNGKTKVKESRYVSFYTYKGYSFWENNTEYTYSGSRTEIIEEEGIVKTVYAYYAKTYCDGYEPGAFQYAPVS